MSCWNTVARWAPSNSCRSGLSPSGDDTSCPTRRDVRSHAPSLRQCLNETDAGETTPVAVKIKLKRLGMIRNPQYRIVVADARTKRDGRAIEEIGLYHPKENPSRIEVDSDRAQYWLGVGAQPTDPVLKIFKLTGDWQKFKG